MSSMFGIIGNSKKRKKKRNKSHSDFWLGKKRKYIGSVKRSRKSFGDSLKLYNYKKAIQNFVSIISEKSSKEFKVRFHDGDTSYTDGKVVTITSNISEDNFDVIVGLAMHEASHIKYTNFDLIPPQKMELKLDAWGYDDIADKIMDSYGNPSIEYKLIRDLLNWIEDRRIDTLVFVNHRGYQTYYIKLYDHYFYSDEIRQAMKKGVLSIPTKKDYLINIINMLNDEFDPNALPGLKEIEELIDVDNIDRLESTEDALGLTARVYRIIDEHAKDTIDDYSLDQLRKLLQNQPRSSDSDDSRDTNSSNGNDTTDNNEHENKELDESENELSSEETSTDDMDEVKDVNSDSTDNESKSSKSDTEDDSDVNNDQDSDQDSDQESGKSYTVENPKKDVDNDNKRNLDDDELIKIRRIRNSAKQDYEDSQRSFLDGDVDKNEISNEQEREIKQFDELDFEYIEVGGSKYDLTEHKVYYIKNIPLSSVKNRSIYTLNEAISANQHYIRQQRMDVNKGFRMGKKLAKKIKVMDDSRSRKNRRNRSGKIDSRLFHEFQNRGNTKIFYREREESYENTFMYVSVDMSSSMTFQDGKFEELIRTISTLAKLSDEVENFDIEIGLRYELMGNIVNVILYNSKKEKINNFKEKMARFTATGTTPESLNMEADIEYLQNQQINAGNKIFVNLTDGLPSMSGSYYDTERAFNHADKISKYIKKKLGYKFITFFIGNREKIEREHERKDVDEVTQIDALNKMYQKDAHIIDMENITKIAKSLNKKLLKK